MKANEVLGESQRKEVEAAIAEVERTTSAEVVCALATESGRYDRAESLIGLMVAVGVLCVANGGHALWNSVAGDWSEVGSLPLGWQVASVIVGFVTGSIAAGYATRLRRWAVSAHELTAEVERSASHVFALAGVTLTAGRTGVLIYVSLFERRVVVLADKEACAALTHAGIESLRDRAVKNLRNQDFTATFLEAVKEAGERLAQAIPAPAERSLDQDELANHLLIFHPRP